MNCPICEHQVELPQGAQAGSRFTCGNCFAQLALHRHKGRLVVGCATCKEEIFDPLNCENCDSLRDKKKLLEEGRL